MKKKMLFVVNNFNIGGPQKSLLSLLHHFPGDIEVDLVSLNGKIDLKSYLPSNVNLIVESTEIGLLMLEKNKLISNLLTNITKNPILCFKVLYILAKNIFNNKPLTQQKQQFWFENNKYVTPKVTNEYDVAIAVSGGHSVMYINDYIYSSKKIGWIRTEYQNLKRNLKLDAFYFNRMDRILSVSHKCTEKFIELFPQEKNKVMTFYNPLPFLMYENISEENLKENTSRTMEIELVTISRLDENKGLDLLLETAKLLYLDTERILFRWKIYGVGPLEKELSKNISVSGLDGVVSLEGFKFNTGEILENADILVHPSKFEGKSNTVDEAKYYRLPIVCTNYPTVSEQITDNITGLIADMNPQSLKDKIVELINSSKLKNELVKNLEKEKENIDSREIFKEFLNSVGE